MKRKPIKASISSVSWSDGEDLPLALTGRAYAGPVSVVGQSVDIRMNDNAASWAGAQLLAYSEGMRYAAREGKGVNEPKAERFRKAFLASISDAILEARAAGEQAASVGPLAAIQGRNP